MISIITEARPCIINFNICYHNFTTRNKVIFRTKGLLSVEFETETTYDGC